MSVIPLLASQLNRNDEVPNTELAERITASADIHAVAELAESLKGKNKAIRNDAIKVLYEIGERKPELIVSHLTDFLALLDHKDNRLQWGAMAALDSLSAAYPDRLYTHLDTILAASDRGSVITKDHALNILISLSSNYPEAVDLLAGQLQSALPNQLPMYAERALPVMTKGNRPHFTAVLSSRLDDIEKESKRKRVEKVIKRLTA